MSNNMPRRGVIAGVISILFSTFFLVVMPAFTPGIIAAPLLGVTLGAISLAYGARRTAIVVYVFALVPLCGFLAYENLTQYVGTGYVAFAPLAVAIAIAAWMMTGYWRARRTAREPAT